MTAQPTLPDRQVRTIEDLLSLPDDGHRYEVIDGSLLVSPAAPMRHQVAADRIKDMLLEAAPDGVDAVTATAVDISATSPAHELAGDACREVGTVRAGESVRVDGPFPVELRPAELVGPRRRG